ncbi:MAG: hypothetical protein LBV69_01150 [Bacteroidales bacterium]|jgi:hypothetical protein|nr:hypothetical protein [Bacteroidales bacterium]
MEKEVKKVELKFEKLSGEKFQKLSKEQMDKFFGGQAHGYTESGARKSGNVEYSNDWTKSGCAIVTSLSGADVSSAQLQAFYDKGKLC